MSLFVYLASQSPRRQQLLQQLGVSYELLAPEPEEDAEALEVVHGFEAPAAYVQRVTMLKLQAALVRLHKSARPAAPVVCADTTVAYGRTMYGKPSNAQDAERILGALSGKTHRVLTAVAVQHGPQVWQALSTSFVRFAPLSPAQIRAYVATQEPMGKAGAYAVQGRAAMYIERITGSYSGIMGLPLRETAGLLRAAGLEIL